MSAVDDKGSGGPAPDPVPNTPSSESESASAETPGSASAKQASASGSKRKARYSDVEPRTPAKRQRVPVSRFQSPLEELEPRFKPEKEEKKKDENVTLYKKGTFLAVRGAEGSFYLCRTAQNIYSKSKKLRIQWLSLEKSPSTYKFDYVDNTEMETVLTEISMEKMSKDRYKLPTPEQKRIEKILDRAIRVEKGIATADEVEEEAMEEIEQEQEDEDSEEEEPTPKRSRGSAKKSPGKGARGKSLTPAQKKKEKEKEKQQKLKEKAKAGKKDKGEKKKGPDRNLKPNPKIKILEKEPFFDTKEKIPDISPRMTTKLIFRAVKTGDVEALNSLLARTEGVFDFDTLQSPGVQKSALHIAGEQGKLDMIEPLAKEYFGESTIKRKSPPQPIISSMNTGVYNPAFLGVRNIRALNAARGGKEGNNAFLNDLSDSGVSSNEVIEEWMKTGVSVETMEFFLTTLSVAQKCTRDEVLPDVIEEIHSALAYGNRALAAKYVAEAERLGGFGFNFLHKEVLNFSNENLRDIILAASVRKKPFSNNAVTPLHCAAINPNVKYLRRLLSIEPDINIQTRSRMRPIHFAAACEGTGPLEFLLERNASPNETDSSGNIPLHYAARSGRSKNIDVLIKHAKTKGDGEVSSPKWGVGGINRPNRFSFCPLHLAVLAGKNEGARTLIKHGADVNKQLNAGKDKKSPLMLAAERGDLTMVRLLVENGAAVELLDKKKRSALTFAIINGHTHVASYLLYLGADPNRVDSSNNSLVHYAAAYGWYFCLKLLVKDAGANADTPNDWQTTPVGIALMKGHTGLVEYLINQKGVDINFKSDEGLTLVSTACASSIREGLDQTVEYMVNKYKADPTIKDINGFNALHHLAANNVNMRGTRNDYHLPDNAKEITVNIAKVLLAAGCDPSQRTNDGKTPVMLAIEQVNVDLVCFLVENGGTVSPEKNSDEKTVLHLMAEWCCTTDLTPLLKILAEHKPVPVSPAKQVPKENGKVNNGPAAVNQEEKPMEVDAPADAKKTDGSGDAQVNNVNGEKEAEAGQKDVTPAADATQEQKPAAPISQQDVLKKMAQDRDFTGFTPLLRACFVYKNFQLTKQADEETALRARSFIQALIELAGSDVNAVVGPKNMPEEPEEHYTSQGKSSALHFMVNPASEKKTTLGAGLSLLLRFSPNTEQLDLQNKTPLVLAIEADKEKIVKALLEGGANPNTSVTIANVTVPPLILAAERGSFGIMKLLIQHKADVKATSSLAKETAVHIMVKIRVREDETIAMIQALLQAGADINALNKEGCTPLHLAVRSNRGHSDASTSMEEFLLDRGADVFAKDKAGMMPLHYALNKSGVDPIELCSLLTSFMRDNRVDEPNEEGFTPLLYAACSGATICCMHLLQRNANIEAKEYRGNTPLNMAIYGGHDSCAIMLMQRHASLSHPIVISPPKEPAKTKETEEDKKKVPVLTWRPKKQWQNSNKEIPGQSITLFEGAVKNDLTGVAHMLLDAQGMPMEAVEAALNLSKFNLALRLLRRIPDVNRLHAKNKDGQNLFHVLALKTNRNFPDLQIKVAAALLEKRIPLGEQDSRGMTPLMYAALKHQSVGLAKFLIQNDMGFNPKVKDKLNRDVMAAFFWEYEWVSDSFKVEEVKEWLEVLIDSGRVSLNTLFDRPLPDTLLFGAKLNNQQTPEYFEAHGGNLTSPLIFTIRNYDFGLAKYLLQKGANPNFCDSQGLSPMMHAVKMNDIKLVKLLLNYDYDLEADKVIPLPGNLKPQLSKQQSRQVFGISFENPKEKNPDDIADEEALADLEEEDAVSLSKHTEENENSVELDDDDDEKILDDDLDVTKDEDEDEEEEEEADSDHDTDVVEDDTVEDAGPTPVVDVPAGATKLSLSRHVSQMMKEREYPTVAKSSSVDLSQADKNGWTAVHHGVCSLDHATFDNAEIVFVLGKAGAPLEAKTNAGETPMDLARRTDAVNIVKVLNKLLAAEPYKKPPQPFDSSPAAFVVKEPVEGKVKPDYRADSEEMLNKLDTAADPCETSVDGPPVDKNCELKSSGEIARHATTNIPYDVTLSKVDVNFGVYGMYNFYKLQIVRHTAKNLFVLFTRWGRIGDRGQYQHTPFQTLPEAAKEFCKIYKSKTGNDWNQTSKFQNHPKKYRLMPKPEKQHKQHKVEFAFESNIPTKLPEPLLHLIKEMSNVSMFQASIEKVGLDEDFLPFGRMKRKTLLEARKVLTELSELIDKGTKLSNNLTPASEGEYQRNCEEISQLTNEYYHLLPIYGFESEMIRPISKKQFLRDHTRLLSNLMDLEAANTILLGANLRKPETNPMDYIYGSLGCSLQSLSEDDPETQFILTNIHASASQVFNPKGKVSPANINRIFKVSREGEDARLAATNLPNHQLLWHGSSMANFISILSRGLLVTPPEVPWTGHLFGEGIYFADTFQKAANYCHNHSLKSTCKIMLLCEVALGNPKIDVKHGDEDHLDEDINSLKILGQYAPVPDFDARLPFGASLPLGQVQKMDYHPPAKITHNEYIVHNPDQVAIRYLVLFNA